MQKSIVALAVAGVLAASAVAQAETTLYGSARIGVEYTEGNASGSKSAWDVANQGSRLGVKGSEDLGGGLSAIYQYEFGVNIDGGTNSLSLNDGAEGRDGSPVSRRLSFVGLQGGFGTVALGRQFRPAYTFVSQYTDIFNGNITNPYSLTSENQRVSDAVAYVTPTFGGFTAAAAVLMNGGGTNCKFPCENSNREDIDAVEVGAGYSNGPLNIGVSYSYQPNGGAAVPSAAAVVQGAEFSHYGIGGSFVAGPFTVGASYEYTDFDKGSLGDIQGYGVVLGFDVMPSTTLRGTYGNYRIDSRDLGDDNQETWGVGVEHRLSKRTMVYAEFLDSDMPEYTGTFDGKGGKYTTLGMRHDF